MPQVTETTGVRSRPLPYYKCSSNHLHVATTLIMVADTFKCFVDVGNVITKRKQHRAKSGDKCTKYRYIFD